MKVYKFYGFELFNASLKRYGGHWRVLYPLFNYKLTYLGFYWCKFSIKKQRFYYDGWHNTLELGFIEVCWGN